MWKRDRRRRRLGVDLGVPVCGQAGAKRAKKPRKACNQRCSEVAESPAPENPLASDVTEMDVGGSPNEEDQSEISDKERTCYDRFMAKKLDDYQPMWVS